MTHEPVCPGVCDLKDGPDLRGPRARTHEITGKVEFALLEAEPEVLGLCLNVRK